MTDREKLLSNEQKDDLRDLLWKISEQIKAKEEVKHIETGVDEKLLKISKKIDNLTTKQEAKNFLDEVKEELAVLKEYQAFKELLWNLERKVDEIKEQYTKKVKDKIAQFKQQEWLPDLNNLTPEQMVKLADKWRKNAANEISDWVVTKLAQRDDWIGKIAKKALNT